MTRFYNTPRPLPEWVTETCKDTSKPCYLTPKEVQQEMERRLATIKEKCITPGETAYFRFSFRGCINSDGYLTFSLFPKARTSPLSHCVASKFVETPYTKTHFGSTTEVAGSISYSHKTDSLTLTNNHAQVIATGLHVP
jgi:hypothetical protein